MMGAEDAAQGSTDLIPERRVKRGGVDLGGRHDDVVECRQTREQTLDIGVVHDIDGLTQRAGAKRLNGRVDQASPPGGHDDGRAESAEHLGDREPDADVPPMTRTMRSASVEGEPQLQPYG